MDLRLLMTVRIFYTCSLVATLQYVSGSVHSVYTLYTCVGTLFHTILYRQQHDHFVQYLLHTHDFVYCSLNSLYNVLSQ